LSEASFYHTQIIFRNEETRRASMGWPFVWFRLFWPRKINERPPRQCYQIKVMLIP